MAYPYTHEKEVRILSKHFGEPEARTLEGWKARGGYTTLTKAFEMGRDAVIDEVKASGLRGRGGAGFPAGVKWSFMPKEKTKPHFLLCNADESEPGTFKDRYLMEDDPHQLLEGIEMGAQGHRHHRGPKAGDRLRGIGEKDNGNQTDHGRIHDETASPQTRWGIL